MKYSLRVDVVIFDMDGVITNTMPYHFRAWRMIFSRYGMSVPSFEIYRREGQKGLTSVHEIFKTYGRHITNVEAQKFLNEKERLLKKIVKRRFIKGSRQFIKSLRRRGFLLALVTGTSRSEVQKILPQPLYQAFQIVICGCDVRNGKPHPEPYEMAITKLAVRKKNAVVIENAPFGIQSAKRAGLTCLGLATSLPKEFLSEADDIFLSFHDLQNRIDFRLATPHDN